jgi:Ca2+-binding RTX toxin-like protein
VAGDTDWFRIILVAGVTYRFDALGLPTGDGTLADTYMRVRDSAGNSLALDDDSGTGLNSRIAFTAASSGTYFISVGSATTTGIGTYDVTATTVSAPPPVDDFAGSTATTGAFAIGGSRTGNVEVSGDTDWFRVTLEAGRTYRFDAQGSPTGQGTLPDTYMRVRDSGGNSLALDDDSGTGLNSQITFTAATSGTYYVSVGAADTGTGTYRVSGADVTPAPPPDDFAASTATTGTLSVGGVRSGNIEVAGDADWFRITLEAGKTYRFDAQGSPTGQGTLADTYMRVRDSVGNSLALDDDSGTGLNSQITFVAPTAGIYYVSVGAATATDIGTYKVSAANVTTSPPPPPPPGAASTGGGVLQRAIQHLSEVWGTANCTGFVYTVSIEAGNFFFDLRAESRQQVGPTGAHTSQLLNNGGSNDYPFVVPIRDISNGATPQADPDEDRWMLIDSNRNNETNDAFRDFQPGDLFRGRAIGNNGVETMHSGVVAAYNPATNTLWLVDNFVPGGGGAPIAYTPYVVNPAATSRHIGDQFAIYRLISANQNWNDLINGSNWADFLGGGRGSDFINGGAGADTVFGGVGNDTLNGGTGADRLDGGADNDTYQLGAEATGVDTLSDSSGVDTVRTTITRGLQPWAFIENLILDGTGHINGTGNGAANTIFGNTGSNFLVGQGGNDNLLGGGGNDWLYGQAGRDTLKGEAGNDRFVLQSINDSQPGSANRDVIIDLDKNGDDIIDLTAVAGVTSFIGLNGFTAPGQVRVQQMGADVLVQINTVGNSVAEAEILVANTTIGNGATQLSSSDFLL